MRLNSYLVRAGYCVMVLVLNGCAAYFHQPTTHQRARLGEESPLSETLRNLPPPKEALATAVYKFRDQTGQYKPAESSNFSTAVTQGATNILLKAMEDSKWFLNMERENVSNLLNERKIIRSSMAQYGSNENDLLPPLLFAGMILEGGIVSYDANIITGGAGLRYFGAGGSTEYRQDRVTVYLRAIATRSGKILKTVYASKTILSQSVNASLFRYVKFKRILETETGFSTNEPSQMAVTEAIEKAVQALVLEGIRDSLWTADEKYAEQTKQQLAEYEEEKALMATTDVWGVTSNSVERPRLSITPYGSVLRMKSDYEVPTWKLGYGLNVNLNVTPKMGVQANGFVSSFSTSTADRSFTVDRNWRNADLSLVYQPLPYQPYTPFFSLGGGLSQTATGKGFSDNLKTFPYLKGGVGLEAMLTKKVGLRAMADYYWMTDDTVDDIANGQVNDSFLRFSAGISFYIGKGSRKRAITAPMAEPAAPAATPAAPSN